mgnify:FL=1
MAQDLGPLTRSRRRRRPAGSQLDKLADVPELWDRYVEENGVIIGPVSLFEVDAEARRPSTCGSASSVQLGLADVANAPRRIVASRLNSFHAKETQ